MENVLSFEDAYKVALSDLKQFCLTVPPLLLLRLLEVMIFGKLSGL